MGLTDCKWFRVRFFTSKEDYRPVKFPPPGPYWCTGYGAYGAVIIAYIKQEEEILEYWPEATYISSNWEKVEVIFCDRFQRPVWWKEGIELVTDEEMKAIRKRCEKALPPYSNTVTSDYWNFFDHAREDMKSLLDEIDRLKGLQSTLYDHLKGAIEKHFSMW